MGDSGLTLWTGNTPVRLPAKALARDIVPIARQLTVRDRTQILSAFESGHYEMVATFVWNKALTSLKAQLGKLGPGFISEMLDRPDIDQGSPIEQKLTDYEALRLAEELGVVRGTGAFRLRQAFERITHFGSLQSEEAEEEEFAAEEAIGVLRACVENVLGFERIEAALDFKRFRDSLVSQVLLDSDESIEKLKRSPYFFPRACMRILLSLIKGSAGAQLENALANANLIVPEIWAILLQPERYQVGRAYSELIASGHSTAASGLKKLLLKVRGFDFVPEDLRSTSFVKAAHDLIVAHEGMNNFYNEAPPARVLERMGSTIPIPAFPLCMSAALSVRLGNRYGTCWDAQTPVNAILKRVPRDRWVYYLNQCLPTDDRVLYKLLEDSPARRWSVVVQDFSLEGYVGELAKREIKQLVTESENPLLPKFRVAAERLISKIGYSTS